MLHDGAGGEGLIGAEPRVPARLVTDVRRRAVVAWAGIHVVLAIFGLLVYPPLVSLGVLALVPLTVLMDIRVCSELVLLANLGVSRRWVAAQVLLPALLLETLWQLIALGARA